MIVYFLKRILISFVILVSLSFIIFSLLTLMPGDPLDVLATTSNISSEEINRIKAQYGFDQPTHVRYLKWVKKILNGELGYSRTYKTEVVDLILPCLFNTFLLSIGALFLSLIISIPFGVYASIKKETLFDRIVCLFAFAGISVPGFWVGIVLIIVFSINFNIFPSGGSYSVEYELLSFSERFFDRLNHLFLPVVTLTVFYVGTFVRYTRSAMLEVLSCDYIRTAKSKGLKKNKIYFVHALKNALIPIVTVISINVSYIFSGAVIVETVFSFQGVGQLLYKSVMANDFEVAMIGFLIISATVLLTNMITDYLYTVINPLVEIKDI